MPDTILEDSKLADCSWLVIIVPAYNEAASLEQVVRETRQSLRNPHIVVIDDGSSDASSAVAKSAGAMVVTLPYNLGIGGAVQTGYRFARDASFEVIARVDGDGQHDPSQLTKLLEPILAGEADVVIGSRFIDPGVTNYRSSISRGFGITFFAHLVSLLTGQRFTDTTSGFQAIGKSAAEFLSDNLPDDYPEIEALVMLCRAGFRVREVPVMMRPREAGTSSITLARSVYYVCKVSLALLIARLQSAPRLRGVSSG